MRELRIKRSLTVEQANELIGADVEAIEPTLNDEALVIDEDTGEPVLLYARLPLTPADGARYRLAVRNVPISTTLRGSGTRNRSRTFGMASRNVILRRESCRAASLAKDAPEVHSTLVGTAVKLADQLQQHYPGRGAHDQEIVNEVLPEWRMVPGSVWTSGVVNLSSALPYHRDRANFPTWSAMPVFRRGVRGGCLHVPEYDVTIGCRDGFVVYFNGNELVHGVTPMHKETVDAYRYSIVYYSIRGMKDCHAEALEQAAAARRRTAREENPGIQR